MRTRVKRPRALLASRSPPRCRRWRSVCPELAGMGATPQSRANTASDLSRWGLSPAVTRSCPAVSTPTRCGIGYRAGSESGAGADTMLAGQPAQELPDGFRCRDDESFELVSGLNAGLHRSTSGDAQSPDHLYLGVASLGGAVGAARERCSDGGTRRRWCRSCRCGGGWSGLAGRPRRRVARSRSGTSGARRRGCLFLRDASPWLLTWLLVPVYRRPTGSLVIR